MVESEEEVECWFTVIMGYSFQIWFTPSEFCILPRGGGSLASARFFHRREAVSVRIFIDIIL